MATTTKYNNAANPTIVIQLASSDPSIIFNNLIDISTGYTLRGQNIAPASGTPSLIMQCSTDNGVTFDTGSVYQWGNNITKMSTSSSNTPAGSAADTSMIILPSCGTGGFNDFDMTLFGAGTVYYPGIAYKGLVNQSGTIYSITGAGIYTPASPVAINAVRFSFVGGINIATGTFSLTRGAF